MARKRMLDPNFFCDEKVVQVSAFARLMFQGLWCVADKEGRLERKPLRLKMQLFPADNVDGEALISELEHIGLIQPYTVNGATYLLIPGFAKHQHVHPKEAPSKLPPPPVVVVEKPVEKPVENTQKVMDEPKARENGSCMTGEPGKTGHEPGVGPSDTQAFGYSGPSELKDSLKPAVSSRDKKPDKKPPKPEKLPDPRHAPLVAELTEAFQAETKAKYPFAPADAAAVSALLQQGLEPPAIVDAWRRALRSSGFPHVRTLQGLVKYLAHFVGTGPPAASQKNQQPSFVGSGPLMATEGFL